jgi:hypothetical protein
MISIYMSRDRHPVHPRRATAGAVRATPREMATGHVSLPREHDSLRESATLGLVVATTTWVWLALIDAAAGEPFRTFGVLGGIGFFTVMHYLLNLAYAVAIVSLIHGAVRQPSLMLALGFGFIMMEFAFAMATVLLSQVLGELAWVRLFVGSLIGAVVAIIILARRHPLAAQLRKAEEET